MDEAHGISLRERIRINLISAMESANINQVQLAEKLGISKGTVNNWARGNNSPDVDMVPKICDVLGISVLDLYSPTKFEPQENAKKRAPVQDGGLNKEELTLVELFRRVPQEQRRAMLQAIEMTLRSQGLL